LECPSSTATAFIRSRRPWTTELSGGPIASGHHNAEDAPEELAARLSHFLAPGTI